MSIAETNDGSKVSKASDDQNPIICPGANNIEHGYVCIIRRRCPKAKTGDSTADS